MVRLWLAPALASVLLTRVLASCTLRRRSARLSSFAPYPLAQHTAPGARRRGGPGGMRALRTGCGALSAKYAARSAPSGRRAVRTEIFLDARVRAAGLEE